MLAKGKKNRPPKNLVAEQNHYEQPNEFIANIEEFRINPNIELPAENILISIQGKTILSNKNVCVISGKPKSRKSVIAHSIISAAISKQSVLGIECNTNKNVVLIDTEQSHHDLLRSINRMKSLAEIKTMPNNLKIYSVRQLNVIQIQNLLKVICQDESNEIIIIDGALDLINNINDIDETKAVIDIIKQILVKHNISLVMVIHQSKSTNFTIGHFGSYFDRFSQSVIEVSKQENGNSKIASAMMRSDADFQPYEFYWNFNTNNYSIDWKESENLFIKNVGDWPIDKHLIKIKSIYIKQSNHNYTSLVKQCIIEYQKSEYWCKKLIKHLFDNNALTKNDMGDVIIADEIPF